MVSKKGSKKEVTLESLDEKLTLIEGRIARMQKKNKEAGMFRGIHLLFFGMIFLGIGLPLLINSIDFPKDPSVVFSFIFILFGFSCFIKGMYDMEQDGYF